MNPYQTKNKFSTDLMKMKIKKLAIQLKKKNMGVDIHSTGDHNHVVKLLNSISNNFMESAILKKSNWS
jgi:hypothetical protein